MVINRVPRTPPIMWLCCPLPAQQPSRAQQLRGEWRPWMILWSLIKLFSLFLSLSVYSMVHYSPVKRRTRTRLFVPKKFICIFMNSVITCVPLWWWWIPMRSEGRAAQQTCAVSKDDGWWRSNHRGPQKRNTGRTTINAFKSERERVGPGGGDSLYSAVKVEFIIFSHPRWWWWWLDHPKQKSSFSSFFFLFSQKENKKKKFYNERRFRSCCWKCHQVGALEWLDPFLPYNFVHPFKSLCNVGAGKHLRAASSSSSPPFWKRKRRGRRPPCYSLPAEIIKSAVPSQRGSTIYI